MCQKGYFMIRDYYENLQKNENLRENLSFLRNEIKDANKLADLQKLAGDGSLLIRLLEEEDAKVRKNAALLIGDLKIQPAIGALLEAYQSEPTLFVKSSYLVALGKLDTSAHIDFFKERFEELKNSEIQDEEKKHIGEELRELSKIIVAVEGVKKHKFVGFEKPHKMILTTNREQRNVTLDEVLSGSKAVQKKAEEHPLGVQVFSKEVLPFTQLRSYRELLFPIQTEGKLEGKVDAIAKQLWDSDLFSFLQECHKGDAPFYFRLEIKSAEPQVEFVKKLGIAMERASGWQLLNSAKDYEVEIRLMESKEGGYVPFVKLFTMSMKRFAYRKNAVAMSIHPATAAMLVQLAKPYMKEGAQVLDPCCGVGTMLIERDICVPAGDMYALDIFGEAIEKGRENATLAGVKINFIHRDFFDFKHDYKFDEIITNMPVKGKKTKEELDAFYEQFFKKAKTLLAQKGIIIMYSNENSFVKKQMRLQTEYRLLQEFCIRKKDNFYLFIIGLKG